MEILTRNRFTSFSEVFAIDKKLEMKHMEVIHIIYSVEEVDFEPWVWEIHSISHFELIYWLFLDILISEEKNKLTAWT